MMEHNKVVQREFSKQASRFGDRGLTLSSQDILKWIVESLPLEKDFRVLDAAAGTGHLSLAIAPHVSEVVAIDITPAMLTVARAEAAAKNIDNIYIQEGDAEQLPYRADHFDFVVSRLSIHHFEQPRGPLREMVRVCKPNHRIAIIDLLAPADRKIAKTYNDLERLRDPSHSVAFSQKQMEKLLRAAGIHAEKIEIRDVKVDFQKWVAMTETEPVHVESLKARLLDDLRGGAQTGMRPFLADNELKFLQVWSIFIGTKISNIEPAL